MNEKRWLIGIGLAAAVLCSVSALGGAPATQPSKDRPILGTMEDREYEVICAVLKATYMDGRVTALTGEGGRIGGVGPRIDQVVIAKRTIDKRLFEGTVPEEEDEFIDEGGELDAAILRQCPPELAKRFAEHNRRPAALTAEKLKVEGLQVALLRQDAYAFPEMPDLREVYRRFPRAQGITLYSRAAISDDGGLAVVAESTMRAPLYGHGALILLKKEGAGWKIVERRRTWVS